MFDFHIHATEGFARAGTFMTHHGAIQTPIFMPVGTNATVKWLTREEIKNIGSQIILSNTYHLHLRPGEDIIDDFWGLHKFMNVDLPILTDSGGYQVFSLGNATKDGKTLVKITEDGVEFRSHLDGRKLSFTPEKAMETQEKLGADIIMAFDECAPGKSTQEYAKAAMDRTHRWARRCLVKHTLLQEKRKAAWKYPQALFPIIQWVTYPELRKQSCDYIGNLDCPGVAIGGLSVGEGKEITYKMLDVLAPVLPKEKPHYLMGVGTPEDLLEAIDRGIDMFDCVLPTRLGRHSVAFSSEGNIRVSNESFHGSKEYLPVQDELHTSVSKHYTLGYLRHLVKTGESLGAKLLSIHNLEFLINLTQLSRKKILEGKFQEFKKDFFENYTVTMK